MHAAVHLSHVRASAPQGKGQKRGQGQQVCRRCVTHVVHRPRDQRRITLPPTQMENWIELEALAVAKRRRDMPRLSEKHGEEGSSADEEEAADDEMKVKWRDEGLYELSG